MSMQKGTSNLTRLYRQRTQLIRCRFIALITGSLLSIPLTSWTQSIASSATAHGGFKTQAAVVKQPLSPTPVVLQTFSIQEHFGVSHPDQIIDFDYPTASALNLSSTCMIGPDKVTQVPFQVLSTGKIAVRTSLTANQSATWQLLSGCTPHATPYADQVAVQFTPSYVQLTNSITGVRIFNQTGQTRSVAIASVSVINNTATITTAAPHDMESLNDNNQGATGPWSLGTARSLQVTISGLTNACRAVNGSYKILSYVYNPSPTEFVLDGYKGPNCSERGGTATVLVTDLAPIQGVQLRNGTWTATGPNKLTLPNNSNDKYGQLAVNANTVTTTILEKGPLEVVVEVSYSYSPFQWWIQNVNQATTDACAQYVKSAAPCTLPPVNGYYTSTVTLEAGQPSILIEDATNFLLAYKLNVYGEVEPDQGRYSSYAAASTPQLGYEPGNPALACTGTTASFKFHDCYRDFDPSVAVNPFYQSDANDVALILAWNCGAIPNTGWYWMIYNKEQANVPSTPVVGAYAGRASRALGDQYTGVAPYFLPDDGGERAAGFEFVSHRNNAAQSYSPDSRFNWALFVGSAGADLGSPYDITTIQRQFDLHGGFNLNKIYRYVTSYEPAESSNGSLFGQSALIERMIERLRSGTADAKAYNTYLADADPVERPLINMWADSSGAATHTAVLDAATLSTNILNAFVNNAGIFDGTYHYWHGGAIMSTELPVLAAALGDPRLTSQDKATVEAVASLFGYILQDNDFVPLTVNSGMSLGTANMPAQQQGYAAEYAAFLAPNPGLTQYSASLPTEDVLTLAGAVDPEGASRSNPHYTGGDVLPVVFDFLQLQAAGVADEFAQQERLTRFGELIMQLSTPPEVRYKLGVNAFNQVVIPRKTVEEGNGSTEGDGTAGVLAAGFRPSNPTLAARLTGAWLAQGQPYDDYFGNELQIIDPTAPATDPQLKSDSFPGYMSVLRSGWGTNHENALWLWNGDFLSDHRNLDRGSVVLYALKAPLSVQWSSFYSPVADGANMMSMVVSDKYYPLGWDQDNQPIMEGASGWVSSGNEMFEQFTSSSVADALMTQEDGLNWQRKLYLITPDTSLPVIMIKDNFSGSTPWQPKTVSFMLMASGAVQTPAGPITPITRLNTTGNASVNAYPSLSEVYNLSLGLNKFVFSGQTWLQHPTGGIDWDLYTVTDEPAQFGLGSWGHNWSPTYEEQEFRSANGVGYSEIQQILRIHGDDNFFTLILPYTKGTDRSSVVVTRDNATGNVLIQQGGERITVNESFYSYQDASKSILTCFDDTSASAANNMSCAGGPIELTVSDNVATITFSGSPGIRTFTLPGTWAASGGINGNALNGFTFDFEGSEPVTVALSRP